jgi:hypothetical protein
MKLRCTFDDWRARRLGPHDEVLTEGEYIALQGDVVAVIWREKGCMRGTFEVFRFAGAGVRFIWEGGHNRGFEAEVEQVLSFEAGFLRDVLGAAIVRMKAEASA